MNAALDTQSQSPLIISETNFSSVNCLSQYDTSEREGPYQMDLYTWLFDHLGYGGWGTYPVRTLWFQEMDDVTTTCGGQPNIPEFFGLYGGGSGSGIPVYKELVSPYYPGLFVSYPFTCPSLFGSITNWSAYLSTLFEVLAYEGCY